MPFDYKKEFKEFYLPASKPAIVTVPVMNFLAVRGKGNPNEEGGAYKQALEQLYGIAYTLKMSYKSSYRIEGFFEYVVPPLEGLWWAEDGKVPATSGKAQTSPRCHISAVMCRPI